LFCSICPTQPRFNGLHVALKKSPLSFFLATPDLSVLVTIKWYLACGPLLRMAVQARPFFDIIIEHRVSSLNLQINIDYDLPQITCPYKAAHTVSSGI
jgi:hypothetical protein